ncbi:zinc-dependent alcohol dehydrogenase family protein [Yinghuangia soli]|uniref:NAD(P)-dependent alcohol dehydrogenase n=1 Tax=Yinghuangia soli TaxID=2908204 RepID=A0AA41PY61_9ACTN|nr:NAD(P)-dependent alcohol dehydrogenase [Yinghuangia soli]MCF2528079.1 NAD(P)-dependent alcohol dehydrogenase [Yinghuangia soli]
MQSYHLVRNADGTAELTLREREIPTAGPGQVLVRMRANSVGFRDALVQAGDYPLPVLDDVVAGCEGAGEVVAIGAGVTRAKPGDRVALTVFPDWIDGPFRFEYAAQLGGTRDGVLAEYAVVSEQAVVPVPEYLSYEEAAALPLTAVTAWNALTGGRRILPGETVLVLGSGGVALAALQFAVVSGAQVVATTSSGAKAARLRELGAHHVVDRTEHPDWATAVRDLTGGRGADLVVDVAGTVADSLRAAALGGEIAYVGYGVGGTGAAAPVDARTLFDSGVRIRGVAVGSRAQFDEVLRAMKVHRMRPVLDPKGFAFADAAAAFAHHRSGAAFGKVVITHDTP